MGNPVQIAVQIVIKSLIKWNGSVYTANLLRLMLDYFKS